jgi:hypothetical protein
MKIDTYLKSTLRRPFRSLLLIILLALISFGFITKTVEFILVQRETDILGSYYRSIGVLKNVKDPQSGDVSAGIKIIENSPWFAYGDQKRMASGVMQQSFNSDNEFTGGTTNRSDLMKVFPKVDWPNIHNSDVWFIGELIDKEEVKDYQQPEDKQTIGYYFSFMVDTLLAGYPENISQGQPKSLLFMYEGNETAIPIIQKMALGERYFIRGWHDGGFEVDLKWENTYGCLDQIIPLNDHQLWYISVDKGAIIDFNNPEMATLKNKIDVENENLHALGIIATTDMSALPQMQEASRMFYLTEGRWLNHQDDLAGRKVIVIPENFAEFRDFKLGYEIRLTFRPLTDAYFGFIRDGKDASAWKSYPTYQETFRIVGIYNNTSGFAYLSFIPNSSLPVGFESTSEPQFRYINDYSFILDSSRNQTQFVREYKVPLEELGINLTFLENNGQAYWAAIDPIRNSLSTDVLIFGVLILAALIMAAFLYIMQHRREYAILRTLGVPVKQANSQLLLPFLFSGVLGIIVGGLPAWNYAIEQAKATLSTLPTPAGVYPSANLGLLYLVGLCTVIFLLLVLLSMAGVFMLSNTPVYELLQGQISHPKVKQKQARDIRAKETSSFTNPILRKEVDSKIKFGVTHPLSEANSAIPRKYNPSSLIKYVFKHLLRSSIKTFLIIAIGIVFILASGWILQTLEQTRKEVNRLYDTTVVQADIIQTNPAVSISGGEGFVSRKTIDKVLNSGFIQSSVLEADSVWLSIKKLNSEDALDGMISIYAYDSLINLNSSLENQNSLNFASGWDSSLFFQQRTLDEIKVDGIPAIFPQSLLEQLQLEIGDVVKITDRYHQTYPCIVVGQYSGGLVFIINTIKIQRISTSGSYILIPLPILEIMEGSKTEFTVAHFALDPTKNRELPQFRADMEKVMGDYGAGVGDVRLLIWDEELRIVVAQLEKNVSILEILYPVLIAVSALIGAGLCFLLLLQSVKEAAIMRILGITKVVVRASLIIEPFMLSFIGAIIGFVIFKLLWKSSGLVPDSSLLLGASLYLAGVLAGSVAGAISVTNKKPMELLQVKE